MTSVYVFNSNRWLHSQLTTGQTLEGLNLLDRAGPDADILLFPVPEWPDHSAPEPLAKVSRRLLERIYLYSTADAPIPWAPGVFASLDQDRYRTGPFRGGSYVSHPMAEGGLVIRASGLEDADLLWSFVGTVRSCPSVRGAVMALRDSRSLTTDTHDWDARVRWGWQDRLVDEGRQAFSMYSETLRRSKFVVCPRGLGTSSIRLFEAMQAGRCPVIVSDQWMPPPFVDWSSCSLRVGEPDVARLPAILREAESSAMDLGAAALAAWEANFAPHRRLATLVNACLDIEVSQCAGRGTRAKMAVRAATTRAFASRAKTLAVRRARGDGWTRAR
jgi:hypothetical protein